MPLSFQPDLIAVLQVRTSVLRCRVLVVCRLDPGPFCIGGPKDGVLVLVCLVSWRCVCGSRLLLVLKRGLVRAIPSWRRPRGPRVLPRGGLRLLEGGVLSRRTSVRRQGGRGRCSWRGGGLLLRRGRRDELPAAALQGDDVWVRRRCWGWRIGDAGGRGWH